MSINKKYIRTAASLGIIFSIIIFIISIIYTFISNLNIIWIYFLVIIAMTEIIAFLVCVLLLIEPRKKIFFAGLISLFAGLIPGIMILSFYFKTKKNLLKNFELDS